MTDADELTISASRSGADERMCLLQRHPITIKEKRNEKKEGVGVIGSIHSVILPTAAQTITSCWRIYLVMITMSQHAMGGVLGGIAFLPFSSQQSSNAASQFDSSEGITLSYDQRGGMI